MFLNVLGRRRASRGQSLVEAAIVIPLLLLLVGGAIDLGTAYHNYVALTSASREGARRGVRLPCDTAKGSLYMNDIYATVKAAAVDAGANWTTECTIQVIPDLSQSCPAAGTELTVFVTCPYHPILGGLTPAGTITLHTYTKMAAVGY